MVSTLKVVILKVFSHLSKFGFGSDSEAAFSNTKAKTTWNLMKYLEKKMGWELQKDTPCCFEQILKAHPTKKQLYRHLFLISNHPSKTSKTCWALLEKLELTYK